MRSTQAFPTVRRRAAAGAVLAGAALAACGGPADAPGGAAAPAGPAGSLVYWHIWDNTREPLMRAQVDAFRERFPRVQVEAQLVANNAQTGEKIVAHLASASQLDVFMPNTEFYHGLIQTGSLLPVDDLLKRDKLAPGEWYDALWKLVEWQGKSYSLPAVNSGPNLFYVHTPTYREAGLPAGAGPATWPDLREHARRTTRVEGGQLKRLGWNSAALSGVLTVFGNRNGVQLVSPDLKRLTFDGPPMLETLEYALDVTRALYGSRQDVGTFLAAAAQGVQASIPAPAFFRGAEVITMAGPFLISQLKAAAPDLEYFVAPVPRAPKGVKSDPNFAIWSYAIPAGTRARDAAWELARFVGHGQGQRDFMLAQGRPSVVKRQNDDPAFKKDNPSWDLINQVLRDTDGPGVPIPRFGAIRGELVARATDALDGKISARDALRQAQEAGQRQLDEFWAQSR